MRDILSGSRRTEYFLLFEVYGLNGLAPLDAWTFNCALLTRRCLRNNRRKHPFYSKFQGGYLCL